MSSSLKICISQLLLGQGSMITTSRKNTKNRAHKEAVDLVNRKNFSPIPLRLVLALYSIGSTSYIKNSLNSKIPGNPLASFDVSGQQRISDTGASPNKVYLITTIPSIRKKSIYINGKKE